MNRFILEKLLDCIGGIDDHFLAEAETSGYVFTRSTRRERMAKVGAYSAAGLAVSVGVAAACLKLRSNRIAKSA